MRLGLRSKGGPCLWPLAFWSNPRWLIAQQAVKSMSWSGKPLTLESGLLEPELASGGLLWCLFPACLCSSSSYWFMSSINFCPEPCPFPVSMVCSTYCPDQWKSRRGLCEGGDGVEKPSHFRAALQQSGAPGSSSPNFS